MVFSCDDDLLLLLPYVFEHGVESFAEFHALAAADVVHDVRVAWLSGRLRMERCWYGVEFDGELLVDSEWVRAAVFRVLGWFVLPLLAASVGGEGFVAMMGHYRMEYERELQRLFVVGFVYGGVRVFVPVVSEQQRLRR